LPNISKRCFQEEEATAAGQCNSAAIQDEGNIMPHPQLHQQLLTTEVVTTPMQHLWTALLILMLAAMTFPVALSMPTALPMPTPGRVVQKKKV
jgi:hypothetical protein